MPPVPPVPTAMSLQKVALSNFRYTMLKISFAFSVIENFENRSSWHCAVKTSITKRNICLSLLTFAEQWNDRIQLLRYDEI